MEFGLAGLTSVKSLRFRRLAYIPLLVVLGWPATGHDNLMSLGGPAGVVAALVACTAIFSSRRIGEDSDSPGLRLLGAGLVLYMLIVAFFRAPDLANAGLPDFTGREYSGELLRLLFAILLPLLAFREFQSMRQRGSHSAEPRGWQSALRWPVLAVGLILAGGWLLCAMVGRQEDEHLKDHIYSIASTEAVRLNALDIRELKGTPQDEGSPPHQRLRSQLIAASRRHPSARYVYLMRLRGNDLVFLADAD